MRFRQRIHCLAVLGFFVTPAALAQETVTTATNSTQSHFLQSVDSESIDLPSGLADPIEPFNRAVWGFNKGFMTSVVRPTSKVYRFFVAKPVRTGIGNFGRNLTYPDRLINNLLQGKWAGARDETCRFLGNTTIGLAGFFDVASRWKISKSEMDFGQTFRKWGWKPGFFLMLPVFGPNDDRDTTGLIADFAANPLTYFFPYSYVGAGARANDLSDTVEGSVLFSQTQADSYSILQYAWSFEHENRTVDMRLIGNQDEASLETLQSVFFTYKNPEFPARGKTRSVLIPAAGKKLDFTFWLQPGRAPVVYLVPGFGSHRLAGNEMALAELLYENGFSAVSISSPFHPEFMEHASTAGLPAYPPVDTHDVHIALTEINRRLEELYPHRLGARALMGYSIGGFETLFLAAQATTNVAPLVKFERYVAIDPPVRLRYCLTNADRFYRAPLAWPAGKRTANIENTVLKALAFSAQSLKQRSDLPFNEVESRFLIGLAFHLALRDIIFSSQLRHNEGVLKLPLNKSRRRAVYDEIMQYSLWDYIVKFAGPNDKARGIDLADPEVVQKGTELPTYSAALKKNHNIRVIANRNDLFLAKEDIAWIEATFVPGQVALFDRGGHLGNLSEPAVQRAILDGLDGLGAFKKG